MTPIDTTLVPTEDGDERLSRRRFLWFGTVAGLGALLALTACGNGDDEDDEDEEEDDD